MIAPPIFSPKPQVIGNRLRTLACLALLLPGCIAAPPAVESATASVRAAAPLSLQQQIDRLPSMGGVVTLTANVTTKEPIRLWQGAMLDLHGFDLIYVGPADKSAILIASRTKNVERWRGGVRGDGRIISAGKGIARDSWGHNLIGFAVRDVTIDAQREAMSFVAADGGWNHDTLIENVTVMYPGGVALDLPDNVYHVSNLRILGGARFTTAPPAMIHLRSTPDGGGGGELIGGRVEVADKPVRQVLFGAGAHAMVGMHLETDCDFAVVCAGSVLTYNMPKWMKGKGLLATGKSLVEITNPYPLPDSFFRYEAGSEIKVSGVKRGQLMTATE